MPQLARSWMFALVTIAVALTAQAQNPVYHAFLWSATTGMQDLGSLGGNSYALGINNSGQVVGYYEQFGNLRPFLWTSALGMQDLGTLGGYSGAANGINSAGEVVGWATTASGDAHGFLWTSAGGMKDLGTLAGCGKTPIAWPTAGTVKQNTESVKDVERGKRYRRRA